MRLLIFLVTILAAGLASASQPYGSSPRTFKRGYHPDPSLVRVIDGDTLAVGAKHIRIVGLDAPELHVPCEHDRANAAKVRLQELLHEPGHRVIIREARSLDKYGRVLARVLTDGKDVAQLLVGQGLAHPYDGGKRESWPGC